MSALCHWSLITIVVMFAPPWRSSISFYLWTLSSRYSRSADWTRQYNGWATYICESFLWLSKKILMNRQVREDAERSGIVWCGCRWLRRACTCTKTRQYCWLHCSVTRKMPAYLWSVDGQYLQMPLYICVRQRMQRSMMLWEPQKGTNFLRIWISDP